MQISRFRGCLFASTAAALLAAGTAWAQQEQTGQQPMDQQQAAQQAQQPGEGMEVGRGPLPESQWEYYDHLQPRTGVLAWLPFEEVLGSAVLDDAGQPIGEIIGLVRSQTEDEFYAVVEPVPDHQVVVPARQLEVRGDRQIVFTAQEPIEMMPTWDDVGQGMATLAALPREPQPAAQPGIQPQTGQVQPGTQPQTGAMQPGTQPQTGAMQPGTQPQVQ